MKTSFYIKIFIAFIIFAILLLGFASFAFNNFYEFHSQKNQKESILNSLNTQESMFKTYIKNYDEKVLLVQNSISKIDDNFEIIEFVEKTLFVDKNILSFKIIALDAKEKLKIENISLGIKVTRNEKLKTIFTKEYFKDMRILKNQEVLHYSSDYQNPSILEFILRNENDFFILKIDIKEIFNKIASEFPKNTLILDTNNSSLDKTINSFDKENYFVKKIFALCN